MRRPPIVCLAMLLATGCHTGPQPRSDQSFDEIVARVATLNAKEIVASLGEPDSRQPIFLRDERWIWWNYTFLAGDDYPPEARGQVVHLEITFRKPTSGDGARSPYSEWRVAQPFGITYRASGSGVRPTTARYRG